MSPPIVTELRSVSLTKLFSHTGSTLMNELNVIIEWGGELSLQWTTDAKVTAGPCSNVSHMLCCPPTTPPYEAALTRYTVVNFHVSGIVGQISFYHL